MISSSNPNGKTIRAIANGLAKRPAYLLIFGLGVLCASVAGTMGVVGELYLQVFSGGSFFAFMLLSILAIMRVEAIIHKDKERIIPDQQAKEEFFDGPNATRLSGKWVIYWNDESSDQIILIVKGSTVFGSCYNSCDNNNYWLIGRITLDGDFPAMIWGEDGRHSGCVYLTKKSNNLFEGTWKGMRLEEVNICDIFMTKV